MEKWMGGGVERWRGGRVVRWKGGEVEGWANRWGENLDGIFQHFRFGLGGKCMVCGVCW